MNVASRMLGKDVAADLDPEALAVRLCKSARFNGRAAESNRPRPAINPQQSTLNLRQLDRILGSREPCQLHLLWLSITPVMSASSLNRILCRYGASF